MSSLFLKFHTLFNLMCHLKNFVAVNANRKLKCSVDNVVSANSNNL